MHHVRFSKFQGKKQIEFHADAGCDPDKANSFTRFNFGSQKAAKILKAMATNGVNDVLAALICVAGDALSDEDKASLGINVPDDIHTACEEAE